MSRARHLRADLDADHGYIEWDPATRRWHAPPRQHLGDRVLIGFGIAVLLLFLGQRIRFLLQQGWL